MQEKIARLDEFAGLRRLPVPRRRARSRSSSTGAFSRAAEEALGGVEPWTAATIEAALKQLCDDLGEKPRTVYLPIRVAVTGSRVSPGLYESLELLGQDDVARATPSGAEAAS